MGKAMVFLAVMAVFSSLAFSIWQTDPFTHNQNMMFRESIISQSCHQIYGSSAGIWVCTEQEIINNFNMASRIARGLI